MKDLKIKWWLLTTTKLFRNEILCSVVFNQAIHEDSENTTYYGKQW